MTTFVLVHGTGCGGWIWKQVSSLLREHGHEVYAPTLTGLSDRRHLLNCGVNLSTHITDIANLIYYEDLADVILVGNSYGGMVITGVSARIPERLKTLIYLDAYLPDDGQSEADLLPTPIFAGRQAEAMKNGGLIHPPHPSDFGIVDPILVAWILARMTPHSLDTYTEPVPTGNSGSSIVPGIYIHCIGNPPPTPNLLAPSAAKALARGWPVIELKTGHLAMLTAPREVAETLLNLSH